MTHLQKTTELMPFPSLSWLRRIANNFLRWLQCLQWDPCLRWVKHAYESQENMILSYIDETEFIFTICFLGGKILIPPRETTHQSKSTSSNTLERTYHISSYSITTVFIIQIPFLKSKHHPNTHRFRLPWFHVPKRSARPSSSQGVCPALSS